MRIDRSISNVPLSTSRGPYSSFFEADNGLNSLQPTLFWQVIFHQNSWFNDTYWKNNFFASKVTIPSESIQVGSIETGPSVPRAPIADGKSSPNTFVIGFYVDIYSSLEQSIHYWLKYISRYGVKKSTSDVSVYGYQMGGVPEAGGNDSQMNPYIQYTFHECFPTNIAEYTYDHTNQKWANVRNVSFGYRDYDIYMAGETPPCSPRYIDINQDFIEKKSGFYKPGKFADDNHKPDGMDFIDFDDKGDPLETSTTVKGENGVWITETKIGNKKINSEKYLSIKDTEDDFIKNELYHGFSLDPSIKEPFKIPFMHNLDANRENDVPNKVFHEKNRKIYAFNDVLEEDFGPGYYDKAKAASNIKNILFGKILHGTENNIFAGKDDDQTDIGFFRHVTVPIYNFSKLHSANSVLNEIFKSPSIFSPYGENDHRINTSPQESTTEGKSGDSFVDDIIKGFYRIDYKNKFDGNKILSLPTTMHNAHSDITEYDEDGNPTFDLQRKVDLSPKIKKQGAYPSEDAESVHKLLSSPTAKIRETEGITKLSPMGSLVKTMVSAFLTPDTPNYHGSLRGIAKVIRKVQQWFYAEPKHKTAQQDDYTRIWEGTNGTQFVQNARTDKNDVATSIGHGSGTQIDVSENDYTVVTGHSEPNIVNVGVDDYTKKNKHGSVDVVPVSKEDTPSNGNFGDTSDVDVGKYDVTTHETHGNVNEKNPDEYDHVVSDDARSISYIYAGDDTVDTNSLNGNGVVIREDDIPSGDISVREIAPVDPDGVNHKEILFNGNDQVKERYDVNKISNTKSDELNTSDISVDERHMDQDDTPNASKISIDERYSDLGDVRDHKSTGVQIKPDEEDVNFRKLDIPAVNPDTMNGVSPGSESRASDFEKRVAVDGDDLDHSHTGGKTVPVKRETVDTQNIKTNVVPNGSFTGNVSENSGKNGKTIPHTDDDLIGHKDVENIVPVKDDGVVSSNIDGNNTKQIHINEKEIDTKKLKADIVDIADEKASSNVEFKEVPVNQTGEQPSQNVSANILTSEISIIDFARKMANVKLVYSETSEKFDFTVKRIKSDENNSVFDFDGKTVERGAKESSVPDTGKIRINTIDVNKNNDKVPKKRNLGKQINVHDFDNAKIGQK